MPLSTEEIVRETHRVALRDNLKQALKTEREFACFANIEREAAERIDTERDGFRTDYTARLSDAREVILRQHTGRFLDHPKPEWAADEIPSPDKVDLLAHNRVQADHDKRIATIRLDEVDKYLTLRDACHARAAREAHAREVRQDHAQRAFTTANEISPHEAQVRGRSGPSQT